MAAQPPTPPQDKMQPEKHLLTAKRWKRNKLEKKKKVSATLKLLVAAFFFFFSAIGDAFVLILMTSLR